MRSLSHRHWGRLSIKVHRSSLGRSRPLVGRMGRVMGRPCAARSDDPCCWSRHLTGCVHRPGSPWTRANAPWTHGWTVNRVCAASTRWRTVNQAHARGKKGRGSISRCLVKGHRGSLVTSSHGEARRRSSEGPTGT